MSFDLISLGKDKDHARYSIWRWPKLYELAIQYGWEPQGTKPGYFCEEDEWDGGYLTNDGQLVTEEDAAAWADALERSLEDIPEHQVTLKNPIKYDVDSLEEGLFLVRLFQTETPLDVFSGPGKEFVVMFISFCRKGAFVIQ